MESDEILERFFELIRSSFKERKQGRFVDFHDPGELGQLLDLQKSGGQEEWQHIFHWLEQYLAYSVKTDHPGFVNRMWVGANLPSILGEMVTAISNTSACTYESAPVSTLMEKYMLKSMLDLAGFTNGQAQMTTGSSNANMIAMMAARNLANPKVKKEGLFGSARLFAFVNAEAHYSMDKAAHILGLGSEQLVKVGVDENGAMDTRLLEELICQVQKRGGSPFFVGATAGTTVRGAYDPIPRLLELRKKYGFWLHVDGAWGGAVIMSETLRNRFMPQVNQVDSLTWDFHKMLGAALICNVLLFNKRPAILDEVSSAGDVSYIFRDTPKAEIVDLGSLSLQCGRRVDSLKWFLDWKFYGHAGFGKRVEGFLELCHYAEEVVNRTPELEMVVPRQSFNVCFRYVMESDEAANRLNQALRTRLYHQGICLVGYGFIQGRLALRLLITHTDFDRSHIDDFFQHVVETGNTLKREYE